MSINGFGLNKDAGLRIDGSASASGKKATKPKDTSLDLVSQEPKEVATGFRRRGALEQVVVKLDAGLRVLFFAGGAARVILDPLRVADSGMASLLVTDQGIGDEGILRLKNARDDNGPRGCKLIRSDPCRFAHELITPLSSSCTVGGMANVGSCSLDDIVHVATDLGVITAQPVLGVAHAEISAASSAAKVYLEGSIRAAV